MFRQHSFVCAVLAAAVLGACSGNDPAAPRIVSFTATPSTVAPGGAAELSWRVEDANKVTISGGPEVTERTQAEGSVATGMLNATTNFVLVAENEKGSVSRSVTVTVASAAAVVESFTASPMTIAAGAQAELSWSTTGAERVNVSAEGVNVVTGGPAAGSFSVTPDETTTYSLVAITGDGQRSAPSMVQIEVTVPTPVITDFTANPNPGERNQRAVLRWSVDDADSIAITDAAGSNVASSTAASGSTEVLLPQARQIFTLTALNRFGPSLQTLTVEADATLTINSFTASPGVGSAPLMVTVNYDVAEARSLTLTANGQPVPAVSFVADGSAQTVSQSLRVDVNQSTRFVLTIENGSGRSRAEQVVVVPAAGTQEMEPNDIAGGAEMLAGGVVQRVGAIEPADDLDWYSVSVPEGGFLRAAISDGLGGCALDAVLTVYGSDAVTELARVDDYQGSPCPVLDPNTLAGVTNLPVGTYYVVVSGDAARGVYVLGLRSGGPGCGNSWREPSEFCDDGNTSDGDGCNSSCAPEADHIYNAPGATTTFVTAALGPGDIETVQVNAASAVYLGVRGYSDAATFLCEGLTPVLTVLSSTASEIASLSGCDGLGLEQRLRLEAGTTYVAVSQTMNPAAAMELVVHAPAVDVCGNGVMEFNRGEDCDDGNIASGDGCSATCVDETPNLFDAPGPAATLGVAIPANGEGLVHLNVSADTYLRAEAFTNAASSDCVGLDPMFDLYDDGRVLLGSDEDDGVQLCPRFDENDAFAVLSPGSYVLRVRESSGRAVGVQTVIEGVAANVCGNGIVEASAFEGCDDGNTLSNDGCSGTCGEERFEGAGNDSRTTAPRLLPFGGRVTVRGSISPSTDVDYFSFNVPLGGQLMLQTYGSPGNLNSCFGNTLLTLENQFGSQVVQDDNDGSGFCSLISPQRDFQVRNLAPGRYFVRVESANNSFTQYLLDIVAL